MREEALVSGTFVVTFDTFTLTPFHSTIGWLTLCTMPPYAIAEHRFLYRSFSQITVDKQFAPIGLTMIGLLASINRVLDLAYDLSSGGEKSFYGNSMDFAEHAATNGFEDIGEVIGEHHRICSDSEWDVKGSITIGAEESAANPIISRSQPQNQQSKKPRKVNHTIDDLFASLDR